MEIFKTLEWSAFDGIVTIISLVALLMTWLFSYINYKNGKRDLEPIDVYINRGNNKEKLPIYLLRKNFSRSEVKGILRELHQSRDHYHIRYISSEKFLKDVVAVQHRELNEIVITIDEGDLFIYEKEP
jgi:hypothetical protein